MPSASRLARPDRSWYQGRFPLVSPPRLDPASVPVPPRFWGVWKWRLEGDSGHLQADVFVVPAGRLVVGRCRNCGGRLERLAEPEATDGVGGGAVETDSLSTQAGDGSAGADSLADTVEQVFALLRKEHHPCNRSLAIPRRDPLTEQFLRRVMSDAGRDIESDERTAGKLYLLAEDGRGCAVETEHLIRGAPAPGAERTANRAEGVEATRRYLRAVTVNPSVAVLVGEAWASPLEEYGARGLSDASRQEVTVFALLTRTLGIAAWSNGDAVPQRTMLKPEMPEEHAWVPIVEPAPLLDGLFAEFI